MLNESKKADITVTTRENVVISYSSEFQFYSEEGRMLIREMSFGNIMVEIQEKGQDPSFSGYYSSFENAESFAKWMAMGL